MKLKNKKTGEIVDLSEGMISETYDGEKIEVRSVAKSDNEVYVYSSLAELNEEWEDYVEPKMYWCVNGNAQIISMRTDWESPEITEACKRIGNYFKTREEAEKAVEKLKAITRLNKCGFKFEGYTDRDRANGGDIVICAHINIPNNNLLEEAQPAMLKDLDLLFGGEE